jgi:2-polyprenyl-3-methyl-5-hydroxy-6-metoxy-1,4-benzoquinol methylase
MMDYSQYLQKIYDEKSFQRKMAYIAHNFGHYFDRGQKVLEIGPGLGEFIAFCNRHGIMKPDVVERDAGVIEYISKNYSVGHTWIAAAEDLEGIEHNLGLYDRIFLLQVLEHTRKHTHVNLLRLLYRHLNPTGAIIIVVPNGGTPLGIVERYWDITHEVAFSENSLQQIVGMADLPGARIEISAFRIPPSEPLNIIRIVVQQLLHFGLKLLMIANGGVWCRIYTPNISLIVHKANE